MKWNDMRKGSKVFLPPKRKVSELVSFPMSRRKEADSFLRDIEGKKFHVNENGIGSTIDVFVVCPCTTLTKIAAKYDLTVTKYTE